MRLSINFCKIRSSDDIIKNVDYLSIPNKSCFFGYHDLDPSFDNGNKVLSHVYSGKSTDTMAIQNNIDVGYFENKDGVWTFRKIGKTSAWCWQQGARLQILNNPDGKKIIFFNVRSSLNSFGSVAIHANDNTVYEKWDTPFNAISKTGQFGGVLNYGLLGVKRPGYGYWVRDVNYVPFIKVIHLSSKKVIYEKVFDDNVEYINHMSFSPDDKWLIYFKFFKSSTGLRERALCVVDLSKCKEQEEISNLKFSHFSWLGANSIILSVSKKLVWESIEYNVETKSRVRLGFISGDFHPYYMADTDEIIFDSYPQNGQRNLYKTSRKFGKILILGKFGDIGALNGEYRVDLHPRYMGSLNAVHVDLGTKKHYRKSAIIRIG